MVSGSDGAYLEGIPRAKVGIIAAFTRRLDTFLLVWMIFYGSLTDYTEKFEENT